MLQLPVKWPRDPESSPGAVTACCVSLGRNSCYQPVASDDSFQRSLACGPVFFSSSHSYIHVSLIFLELAFISIQLLCQIQKADVTVELLNSF